MTAPNQRLQPTLPHGRAAKAYSLDANWSLNMSVCKILTMAVIVLGIAPVYAGELTIGRLAVQPNEQQCGLVFYSRNAQLKGRVFFDDSKHAFIDVSGKTLMLKSAGSGIKGKNLRNEYKADCLRVVIDYHVSKECKQETMPGCEYDELEGIITVEKQKKKETISVYGYNGC